MKDTLLDFVIEKQLYWDVRFNYNKTPPTTILCTSLDCNKGVDEENFSQPCGRCKGTGEITHNIINVRTRDGKWYATMELAYLMGLI